MILERDRIYRGISNEYENFIWKRIRGWQRDIERVALGSFDDPREAVRQLAEFVYLLAEEVGKLMRRVEQ